MSITEWRLRITTDTQNTRLLKSNELWIFTDAENDGDLEYYNSVRFDVYKPDRKLEPWETGFERQLWLNTVKYLDLKLWAMFSDGYKSLVLDERVLLEEMMELGEEIQGITTMLQNGIEIIIYKRAEVTASEFVFHTISDSLVNSLRIPR